MAQDIGDLADTLGSALGSIAHEVADGVSGNGRGHRNGVGDNLGGLRGVAAGAALAAVPMAAKVAAKKLVPRISSDGGGAPQLAKAKEVGKKMIPSVPGSGGKSGSSKQGGEGTPGVGKGRRMPVQQAVDVGVPLAVAYNQWTQFEEWPQFMHRIDRATQEDECTVSFRAKLWGMSKEFVAQIEEQRPDERIRWSVSEGASHSGVVSFHELAPNLTRIQVSLDLQPGSWIEKAARGMRHVKRAVRADLARFKAFIEMQETETGAWRGTIHDGEIVKAKSKSGRTSTKSKSRNRRGSSHTNRKRSSASSKAKRSRR